MGYYTEFEMELVENNSSKTNDELKEMMVEELRKLNVINYALTENLTMVDCVKWYTHEDDLIKATKEVKDSIWLLEGKGEENDDTWKCYACNGKIDKVYAEMKFDEPNWNRLKS